MKLMPMWTKADIWSDDGVTMAIIQCSICAMHKFLLALNAQWNMLLVECIWKHESQQAENLFQNAMQVTC
jgi:hypothetical protein